jgi:hypothetical protein
MSPFILILQAALQVMRTSLSGQDATLGFFISPTPAGILGGPSARPRPGSC